MTFSLLLFFLRRYRIRVLNNTSGGSSGGGGIGTSSSSNNNNGAGGSTTITVSELTVTNVGREDTARYICFAANRHGESQGAIWLYVQGILSSCFLGYLCEMNSVGVFGVLLAYPYGCNVFFYNCYFWCSF